MNVGEIWTVYFLISSLPFISKDPKRSHFSLPLLCHRHYPFSLCFFFFPPSYFFPILSPYPCHSPISTIPRLSIRWRHQSTLSFSFSLSLSLSPFFFLSYSLTFPSSPCHPSSSLLATPTTVGCTPFLRSHYGDLFCHHSHRPPLTTTCRRPY